MFPNTAFAGVFSFVTELFAGENPESLVPVQNSQNLSLLQAVQNNDPDPVKQAPDISILEDSVLETHMGPDGTEVEIEEKEMAGRVSVYEVRSGDSLATIAKMFGVTTSTILWANDLNSPKDLKVGSKLVILPISGVKYIVKKGDTVKSIAKKFGGDEDEIKKFNDLGVSLSIGSEIIIPDGEISTPVSVATKKGVNSNSSSSLNKNGAFVRPASGKKTQGLHGKYGTSVDIGAPIGTAVKASASGRVIVAKSGGWNGGYGNYVVIQHANGLQTLYAHLNTVTVGVGANVSQGGQIGTMGNTGRSTGSHLHFEILGGTKNWNPFN